jgi:hypothetical protein
MTPPAPMTGSAKKAAIVSGPSRWMVSGDQPRRKLLLTLGGQAPRDSNADSGRAEIRRAAG